MNWSALAQFFESLTQEQRFELFNTFLDKLLFGLLIGAAGLAGSILIEKYKAVLVRQQDLTSIFIPKIVELIQESETLYDKSITCLGELHAKYEMFKAWEKKLLEAPVHVDDMQKPSLFLGHVGDPVPWEHNVLDEKSKTDPSEYQRFKLKRIDNSDVAFSDLLADSAPDDFIRTLVQSKEFWTRASLYYSGAGLAPSLLSFYLLSDDKRTDPTFRAAVILSMAYLFAEHVIGPRLSYRDDINKVRLKILRTLEPRSRKAKKALKAIEHALDFSEDTIKTFPAEDVIRVKGMQEAPSPEQRLVLAHAALITQLRRAIGEF